MPREFPQEQDFAQLALTVRLIFKQIVDPLYRNVLSRWNVHGHRHFPVATRPHFLQQLVLVTYFEFQAQA